MIGWRSLPAGITFAVFAVGIRLGAGEPILPVSLDLETRSISLPKWERRTTGSASVLVGETHVVSIQMAPLGAGDRTASVSWEMVQLWRARFRYKSEPTATGKAYL